MIPACPPAESGARHSRYQDEETLVPGRRGAEGRGVTTTTHRSPTRPSSPAPGAPAPVLGSLGLFTVLLGAALPLVDFFIVNVALPSIGGDLGADESLLELVVAGYGLAYAVLLVLGGRLGDLFGRRRLFL
ncbi:MFS transporter, partial [Streptomyces anthocyanicus]|uniref:MFS transporter n=1 Tax=Streptomyces anthocyanicus TaxID=68174 RepID=UPI0036629BA1